MSEEQKDEVEEQTQTSLSATPLPTPGTTEVANVENQTDTKSDELKQDDTDSSTAAKVENQEVTPEQGTEVIADESTEENAVSQEQQALNTNVQEAEVTDNAEKSEEVKQEKPSEDKPSESEHTENAAEIKLDEADNSGAVTESKASELNVGGDAADIKPAEADDSVAEIETKPSEADNSGDKTETSEPNPVETDNTANGSNADVSGSTATDADQQNGENKPQDNADDAPQADAQEPIENAEMTGDGEQSVKIAADAAPTSTPPQTPAEGTRIPTPQPSAGNEGKESDTDKNDTSRPDSSDVPSRGVSREVDNSVPRAPEFESKVATATPVDNVTTKPEEDAQPLNLKWTFGINRNIACVNLSDGTRTMLVFGAAHVAVLYDYKNNSQKLLQGHGNAITCIACSEDKRWLVTGDEGPESCIIIWDTYTGIPVQTIFNINEGVVALAMSSDAKYIVTISGGSSQVVSLWDWTNSADEPLHRAELNVPGRQNYVKFHPHDNEQFVSNSESQVIFYSWSSGSLLYDTPFMSDLVFNRPVGSFSQSIFQAAPSNRALTATSIGNLVVWSPDRTKSNGRQAANPTRRPLKLLRVKDKSITALTQMDSFIVAGDTCGHVRFFDQHLNLLNWYQDLNLGPINGISFDYVPDFTTDVASESTDFPSDATIHGKNFIVRDFVVSTKAAEILHMQAKGSVMTSIMSEHDSAVHALAASPNRPWICIGSYSGLVKLWNYETKMLIASRMFGNREKVQCLAFSHNGLQIAVGMVSGAVHIVDTLTLLDEATFHYSTDVVTHCVFSHDSTYLATADKQCTTTVFKYSKTTGWTYLGRHRAHYKTIMDATFGVDLDSNQHRLLTLGEDRVLVEYDLASSSKDDLRLESVDRIEQSAVPLCLKWYPPVTKETFLIVANSQYKMKLFNTTTKMCRKTLLGPTYGSPVRLISIVAPEIDADPTKDRLMCYATDNKLGLQLLPLDGNPHRSVALIAHPNGVSRLATSYDGRHVFTAGGSDASVHMWSINAKSLEALEELGGDGLVPFYGLIEGGREGEMFAELENYFYFAQLRSQGIDTTEEREVSDHVQLDQVPFLLRALGFYPTEQEVEDILNEVKFSKYVETGEYVTEVDLTDFIKLYINHRPAFGLSPVELEEAFAKIGRVNEHGAVEIDRGALLEILQRKGEHMTEDELADCLSTLLGFNPEGGRSSSCEAMSVDEASRQLEEALPETITAGSFVDEVLALNMYDQ